jgi:hypothetical protein
LYRRAVYRQAVRPAYAAAAPSSDFHLQAGQLSEALPSEAPLAVSAAMSAPVPAWRREAAEASSVASAQSEPSSLPVAAAEAVAAYERAVPPWAEPVGPDVWEQRAEAARAASDARAQPREAAVAVAGPDAAEEAVAAELDAAPQPGAVAAAVLDAELQPGAVAAAELDAELQPGEVAAAVRDAVLRRAAAPVALARRPAAAPSAFHQGQALPWLAPRRAAQFAHAMWKSPAVPRSKQWWPAAGCEGLS